MKFRNCDCPLLNSPDLSFGATQFVIFPSAFTQSVSPCPTTTPPSRHEARTIFVDTVDVNSLIVGFNRIFSCAESWRNRESINRLGRNLYGIYSRSSGIVEGLISVLMDDAPSFIIIYTGVLADH